MVTFQVYEWLSDLPFEIERIWRLEVPILLNSNSLYPLQQATLVYSPMEVPVVSVRWLDSPIVCTLTIASSQ